MTRVKPYVYDTVIACWVSHTPVSAPGNVVGRDRGTGAVPAGAASGKGGIAVELNLFLEVRRCFNVARKEVPAESRIIFDELAVLCTLHDHKGLSSTQLAIEQGISCPTMTHRGAHLSQLGYVVRQPSTDDRRRLRCSLTRKGSNYVHRTAQAIIENARPEARLEGSEPDDLIPVIAKMGSLPMTADSLALLCFAQVGATSMPVMRIVDATALLQPTVSMAILRMEEAGYVEGAEAVAGGRRPMRRNTGCVLTRAGMDHARQLAREVMEL
jgi:DNA-binding MarR family transcriptional regulator